MITITDSNAEEFEVHRFVTEASTLGLPPGQFPNQLKSTIGNGQPFIKLRVCEGYVDYQQSLGCVQLRVFND